MKQSPITNRKNSLYPIQEFEDEDDESWQVSYLDIITIVLGFLIILLSVSQITKSEFTSLSNLFGKLADETEFITTPIGDIQKELFELLKPEIEAGKLEIIRDLNDLRIRFRSDGLYASGSATLQGESIQTLDRVLIALEQIKYDDFNIDVEGHTDNTPITSDRYPSNWELSTARASNVVKYFSDMGIPAKRLKASGYADSRPIIQYDSLGFPFAANKEENRRVVLRLYYTTDNLNKEPQITETTDPLQATDPSEVNPETEQADPTSPPLEETELILMDEPALVTLAEQNSIANRINEVQESQAVAEEPASEQVQEQVSEPEPETVAQVQEDLPDEPEVEGAKPESTAPQNQKESRSPSSETVLPSLLKVDQRCQYSVQIAEFNALSNGFQKADEVEKRVNLPLQITFNNQKYSIRTEAVRSFRDALSLQNRLSGQLNDADMGLIHQCYNNTVDRPKATKYLIQFGAFQNRDNGLQYSLDLFDRYGIQAYMNRVSDTFNVLTGPYDTRDEVMVALNEIKETGIESNVFIRHQPESVSEYRYAYQIQVRSYNNRAEAEQLVAQINQTGINTRVEELIPGEFSVITGQSTNLEQTQTIFNRLKNGRFNAQPVIFVLEYIP